MNADFPFLTRLTNISTFVSDSNATAKKKLPAKSELTLKVKNSKKGQNQLASSTKKTAAHSKPPPSGKRQALLDNKPLVKLPWSVSIPLF